MNKQIWVIANWKNNKTIAEALSWVDVVGPKLSSSSKVKIVVCPTDIAIEGVKKAVMVGNYPMLVGSQDISAFDTGAYTGEEAARLLKDVVDLSILGHSERRENLGETDEMVAEKVMRAREANIIPLVCVQNENTPIPEGVNLVAYEPVFAIGSGNPDTPENAGSVAAKLKERYKDTEVLYGGSVTWENTEMFLAQPDINGLLIGKASLDPEGFLKIIEVACKGTYE